MIALLVNNLSHFKKKNNVTYNFFFQKKMIKVPKIPLGKNSNAIVCVLNIFLRMDKLMNLLPEIQNEENDFFRIFLDLFVQMETLEDEIDINPFIFFFRLDPTEPPFFFELFCLVLSEFSNSTLTEDAFRIKLTNKFTNKTQNELIISVNSREATQNETNLSISKILKTEFTSISPSKYIFVHTGNIKSFELSNTLKIKENSYKLFTIVRKSKNDNSNILYIRSQQQWIKIHDDKVSEIFDDDIIHIKTSKIIILGYAETLPSNNYVVKQFSLMFYKFFPETMELKLQEQFTNIYQNKLIKLVKKYENDGHYLYYKFKGGSDYCHDIASLLNPTKLNKNVDKSIVEVYYESEDHPLLFLNFSKQHNYRIFCKFIYYDDHVIEFKLAFVSQQTIKDLYRYCKTFLEQLEKNLIENIDIGSFQLYAIERKSKKFILLQPQPNFKINCIVQYIKDQDGPIFYFSSQKIGRREKYFRTIYFNTIHKNRLFQQSQTVYPSFGNNCKELFKSLDRYIDTKLLTDYLIFSNNESKIIIHDIDEYAIDIKTPTLTIQKRPDEPYAFFLLSYSDENYTYSEKPFIFPLNPNDSIENLQQNLSNILNVDPRCFSLYLSNHGNFSKLKSIKNLNKATIHLYFFKKKYLPNL